jgi:tryptophan synthase alpha chain
MTGLGAELTSARQQHRLLVPYVMAGMRKDWLEVLDALVACGADAIEVGIPFSDPSMDGPTIQRAAEAALAAGTTPEQVVSELRAHPLPVPVVVMTYYNIFARMGLARMAAELARARVAGVILPDLPLEEQGPWREAAHAHGIETVQLVSPVTDDRRLERILAVSEGFVYGIGRMGITGERETLAGTATVLVGRVAPRARLPLLVGIGISNAEQAITVCRAGADGVVIGSALVRRLLEGALPEETAAFLGEVRTALDQA